jgi:hypothetical protein
MTSRPRYRICQFIGFGESSLMVASVRKPTIRSKYTSLQRRRKATLNEVVCAESGTTANGECLHQVKQNAVTGRTGDQAAHAAVEQLPAIVTTAAWSSPGAESWSGFATGYQHVYRRRLFGFASGGLAVLPPFARVERHDHPQSSITNGFPKKN